MEVREAADISENLGYVYFTEDEAQVLSDELSASKEGIATEFVEALVELCEQRHRRLQ